MKIGIDLRTFEYLDFMTGFIEEISKENNVTIYLTKNIFSKELNNVTIKYVKSSNFLEENTQFFKIIKNDLNEVVITFEKTFPLLYRGKIVKLLDNLDYALYSELENNSSMKKHFLNFLYKNIFKKSKKIIALDSFLKQDLNEHFNIEEEKISVVDGFFQKEEIKNYEEIDINIKNKYGINGEYLIYDGGDNSSGNLLKLIDSLVLANKQNQLNIVFVGEKISKNLELRNYILEKNIQNNTFFIGDFLEKEKYFFYAGAAGIVFTGKYSGFPFSFTNALNYEKNIYCSDLKNIREIFGEKNIYFNPNKISEISEKILNFSSEKINYDEIFKNYNPKNFVENLLELIK